MPVLAIEVEFLGPVLLSDPGDPRMGEWPPAPARVYAALIAAICEHGLKDELLDAVRTLEQEPPALTASAADPYPPHAVMVPAAHSLSYPYNRKNYGAQWACEIVPVCPRVVYHWPVPEAAVAEVSRAVECLSVVGRGESLVLGRILPPDTAPPPNFLPDPYGDTRLRVARPGRFDALERDYQRGRAPIEVDLALPYRQVRAAVSAGSGADSPWGDLLVLQVNAGVDIRKAALLAAGLRAAVLARIGDAAHAQIHGHGRHDHIAWSALPHVGQTHADGRILGLGLWLPVIMDGEADQQIRQAVAGLQGIPLGGRQVAVSLPTRPMAALRYETWTRPARIWATATPLVLENRISSEREASRCIAQSLRRAGFPRPRHVIPSSVPALKGAAHAGETRPRRCPNPRRHAVIEFDEPIRGPVLAGAERYFGLGLFRPVA